MESVLLLVHSRRRFVPVVQDNAEITRFEERVDFTPDPFSDILRLVREPAFVKKNGGLLCIGIRASGDEGHCSRNTAPLAIVAV